MRCCLSAANQHLGMELCEPAILGRKEIHLKLCKKALFFEDCNSIVITVSRSLVPTQKVRLSTTNNVLKQVLLVLKRISNFSYLRNADNLDLCKTLVVCDNGIGYLYMTNTTQPHAYTVYTRGNPPIVIYLLHSHPFNWGQKLSLKTSKPQLTNNK